MSQIYTTNFSDEQADKFKVEPITWQHNLHESELFSDAALISLIENHPTVDPPSVRSQY